MGDPHVELPPRAPTTVAAGVVAALVSLYFLARGIESISYGWRDVPEELRLRALALDIPDLTPSTMVMAGGAMVITSLIGMALAVGVLRRRGGAREGAFVIFGFFAFLMMVFGLFSFAHGGWQGVLAGACNVAVVALLLVPTTALDFERVELARQRARDRAAAM